VILGRHPLLGMKLLDLVAQSHCELVVIPPFDHGRRSVTFLNALDDD
jgi:hypothetical protein